MNMPSWLLPVRIFMFRICEPWQHNPAGLHISPICWSGIPNLTVIWLMGFRCLSIHLRWLTMSNTEASQSLPADDLSNRYKWHRIHSRFDEWPVIIRSLKRIEIHKNVGIHANAVSGLVICDFSGAGTCLGYYFFILETIFSLEPNPIFQ